MPLIEARKILNTNWALLALIFGDVTFELQVRLVDGWHLERGHELNVLLQLENCQRSSQLISYETRALALRVTQFQSTAI